MNPLDREMRALLAQLELISAIPAKNFDAGHGTDDDPGGRRPPGDYGYRSFAEWYGPPFAPQPGCRDDYERETCIKAARRELKHLRKGARVEVDERAAQEEARRQLLDETEGWSVQAVSQSHWRISGTVLRRLRVADSRDAETGRPVELTDETGQDLASRAREMRRAGMTIRGIGMALGGIHSYQVQRLLKRVA